MVHPLIEQLRFARSEFVRGLADVSEDEGIQRFGPMNCISWTIGHLADQEQRYWFQRRALALPAPGLNDLVGHGKPASTPSIGEMWAAWRAITEASDPWLDTLTTSDLLGFFETPGPNESIGTLTQRVIGHYWYHLGEGLAIRQMLGHTDLPQFVGNIGEAAPFRVE